jgi:hypothetical protein
MLASGREGSAALPAGGWLDQLLAAEERLRAVLDEASAQATALREQALAEVHRAETRFPGEALAAEQGVDAEFARRRDIAVAEVRTSVASRVAALRAVPDGVIERHAAALVQRLLVSGTEGAA